MLLQVSLKDEGACSDKHRGGLPNEQEVQESTKEAGGSLSQSVYINSHVLEPKGEPTVNCTKKERVSMMDTYYVLAMVKPS